MIARLRLYLPFIALLLASLACYSDSPFYPFELTPAPPTITPPPPAPQSRFEAGALAYAPASVTEAAFRLELTAFPEPLKSDLSNRARQSCSQNAVVRVLYTGLGAEDKIYSLVDCNGAVGWTLESNLLGPIHIITGQRALTTEAGLDATNSYAIRPDAPPYDPQGRFFQVLYCKVGETVDVLAMSGFSTGELYYKIRCQDPFNPILQNVGWTPAEALFGPLRFRNGEQAIVAEEFERILLTESPTSPEAVAACERGEIVSISATPAQRIEDDLFYEVTCADGTGWTNQTQLVGPLPFPLGSTLLLTTPGVTNSAEARARATPPTEATAEPTPPLGVGLTETPTFLTPDNQSAFCPDASRVILKDYAGVEDTLYAQIDCDGALGWLPSAMLYGEARYAVGDEVLLGEQAVIGFNQRGIYLAVNLFDIEGPSGGSSVIAGECAFDFEAQTPVPVTLTDIGYYRASTGEVVGVFYRVACQDATGRTVEGWMNQKRIGVEEK